MSYAKKIEQLISDRDALRIECDTLRKDAANHKRSANIACAALQLVREYPDFDDVPNGTRHIFADVIDAALNQEFHPLLSMLVAMAAR
jgi:hypothetical protein